MINMTKSACTGRHIDGQLECLKYLRETAKAPWDRMAVEKAHANNRHRVFTIPPRQQLSSPTRLAIRRWKVARATSFIITIAFLKLYNNRKRET